MGIKLIQKDQNNIKEKQKNKTTTELVDSQFPVSN